MTLRRSAFSAGRWTTASALLRLALQFAQTMILARLLSPADFGLMALVAAPIATLAVLADGGMSRALIHFPTLPRAQMSSLYWANLGLSVVFASAFVLAAFAFDSVAADARLGGIVLLAALYFPISALGQQFRVLEEKEMQFSVLARIEVAASLAGFIVAVGLAFAGAGVFALVLGFLATAAANSLMAFRWLAEDRRPIARFDWRDITPMLRFGGFQTAERLAATLQLQADIFLAGALFGPAAIGVYAVPRDLGLRISNSVINPVVTRIGFPLMARLQHDMAALKNVYLQSLRMTTSMNFPIYAAIGLFAEPVTLFVFGAGWIDAAPYLRMFALWGLIRSVGSPVGSLLHAAGLVRRSAIWNIALLAFVPLLLWAGAAREGLPGLGWAMVATQILIFIPSWRFLVRPACGATLREFLAALLPAALATVIACVAAWLASNLADLGLKGDTIVGLAAGAAAYLLASAAINRPWLIAVAELVKWPTRRR